MKKFLPIFLLIFSVVGYSQEGSEPKSETSPDIKVVVQEKETFSIIAERYGVNVAELAKFNGKSIDAKLKKGTIIIIPASLVKSIFDEKEPENKISQAEQRLQQITSDAGRYFKQGLLSLQDNRRPQARDNFDKSVEVFLISGINLNSEENEIAKNCYNSLVETVYRVEFPSDKQPPMIRPLSAVCGWNIENDLADEVAKLVLTAPQKPIPTSNNSLVAPVISSPNKKNDVVAGFTEQKFEPSPLDELAKLELTTEEKYQVVEPVRQIRFVKALSGDTIAKIAQRYGANPVDVANLNGFTSITAAIQAGREIKIPLVSNRLSKVNDLGIKPSQSKDGKVKAVMDYFNEYFNDPYSMRFVKWSPVEKRAYNGKIYWAVQVKFRAKNAFGAYILSEEIYFIKNNKVIATQRVY